MIIRKIFKWALFICEFVTYGFDSLQVPNRRAPPDLLYVAGSAFQSSIEGFLRIEKTMHSLSGPQNIHQRYQKRLF